MQIPAFGVREALESDAPYIISTWLENYRSSFIRDNLTKALYISMQIPRIESTLIRSISLVAHSIDSEDQILGYIVYEPNNILHYIYVKSAFRRFGIGKSLAFIAFPLPTKIVYTHRTPKIDHILKHFPISQYYPLANKHNVSRVTTHSGEKDEN